MIWNAYLPTFVNSEFARVEAHRCLTGRGRMTAEHEIELVTRISHSCP